MSYKELSGNRSMNDDVMFDANIKIQDKGTR